MEVTIDKTQLKVYDNGTIERFNKQWKRWTTCKGSATGKGYLTIGIDNKSYLIHRIVYYAFNKDFDINNQELLIDHKNRNKLDNAINNLRVVNRSENSLNRDATESQQNYYKTKTGFKVIIVINDVIYRQIFQTEYDAIRHLEYLKEKRGLGRDRTAVTSFKDLGDNQLHYKSNENNYLTKMTQPGLFKLHLHV